MIKVFAQRMMSAEVEELRGAVCEEGQPGPGELRNGYRARAAPVGGEREAQGQVAGEKVDRAAADQAQPGHRAQLHTGRALRQK
jgi:hypothetical protein